MRGAAGWLAVARSPKALLAIAITQLEREPGRHHPDPAVGGIFRRSLAFVRDAAPTRFSCVGPLP